MDNTIYQWLGIDQKVTISNKPFATYNPTNHIAIRFFGDNAMIDNIDKTTDFIFQNLKDDLRPNISLDIDVYLYPLIKGPKQFPDNSPVLTRKHINSGMCATISPNSKKIYIFRDDECRKVFFHEMIHALDVLQNTDDFPLSYQQLSKLLTRTFKKHPWLTDFQSNLLVREATTEALACALEAKYRQMRSCDISKELQHSKHVVQLFLDWGSQQAQQTQQPNGDVTHAIEYFLLKDSIYGWALKKFDMLPSDESLCPL